MANPLPLALDCLDFMTRGLIASGNDLRVSLRQYLRVCEGQDLAAADLASVVCATAGAATATSNASATQKARDAGDGIRAILVSPLRSRFTPDDTCPALTRNAVRVARILLHPTPCG